MARAAGILQYNWAVGASRFWVVITRQLKPVTGHNWLSVTTSLQWCTNDASRCFTCLRTYQLWLLCACSCPLRAATMILDMSVHTRCKPIHETNTGCIQGLFALISWQIFFPCTLRPRNTLFVTNTFKRPMCENKENGLVHCIENAFKKPSMTMKKIAGLLFRPLPSPQHAQAFFMLICPH